jgi:alkylhydroperoxidase/carboxymuconolactone decarboxylase family protein YurZ
LQPREPTVISNAKLVLEEMNEFGPGQDRIRRFGRRFQPAAAGARDRVLLGAVWGREELSRKTRSMLNLAMLCALNRPHELRMHIKGALTNGVSREEIREVFLQVAIYCGVPAAVDAFRTAREVLAEIDHSGQGLP